MKTLDLERRNYYADLFKECEDSCILSALSGMNGEMYVDNLEKPEVVIINVADYSFVAGDPESEKAKDCILFLSGIHQDDFNIRCVNKDFNKVVEAVYNDKYSLYSRFATLRSFEYMDFDYLQKAVCEREKEYKLSLIDEKLFNKCKEISWARDLVIGFNSYSEWEKSGLGVVFLKDDEPICGASSYSSYPGGIEVEIITREDFRKKGFGFSIGAALLIECKKRNLLASWDAAHEQSLKLAERLGYKFLYKYDIYAISNQN